MRVHGGRAWTAIPLLTTTLALCPAVAVLASRAAAEQRPYDSPRGGDATALLDAWFEGVRNHRPGIVDEHVTSVTALSRSELMAVHRVLEGAKNRSARDLLELQRLLGPLDGARLAQQLNGLLKRGALLHADIAWGPARISEIASPGSPLVIEDGRLIGYDDSWIHWAFARGLLDLISPTPASDPEVRRWYLTVGAWMRWRLHFSAADAHLARARRLFPDDPDVDFLVGCRHEALASRRVQAFARSAPMRTTRVGSSGGELRLADESFRKVVQRAPDHVEARLRRGRVLGAMGHPEDALGELTRALAQASDVRIQYLAALFAGQSQRALGRQDAARSSYEEARRLFPRAQTASLALAYLARSVGDRSGAVAVMDQLYAAHDGQGAHLFTADREPPDALDPWWSYFQGGAVESDLMREVWGSLRLAPLP